jgi:hypothetical protein
VTSDVYWQVLKDLPLEKFQRAVGDCIRTESRFPMVAELLKKTVGYDGAGALPPRLVIPERLTTDGLSRHGRRWCDLIDRITKREFASQDAAFAAIDELAEEAGLPDRRR